MIYLDYEAATGGDPYWSGVALLVQDGADGTLVIQDRSSFADSVTIANYAEWDSAQQVFGANQILCSTNVADIPDFSDADGSRFGRAPGEPYTIETWVEWNTYPASSGPYLWTWYGTTGPARFVEMYLSHGATVPDIRIFIRIGDEAPINCGAVIADTPTFVQFSLDSSDNYYVDIDGVEVATGSIAAFDFSGVPTSFAVASQFSGSNAYSAVGWSTPLRVTKGVMRTRGSVPTDLFPTS